LTGVAVADVYTAREIHSWARGRGWGPATEHGARIEFLCRPAGRPGVITVSLWMGLLTPLESGEIAYTSAFAALSGVGGRAAMEEITPREAEQVVAADAAYAHKLFGDAFDGMPWPDTVIIDDDGWPPAGGTGNIWPTAQQAVTLMIEQDAAAHVIASGRPATVAEIESALGEGPPW
jgi:hypothetical protein